MRLRRGILADAPVIAAIHVEGWRWAYRGELPDSFLAGLSTSERLPLWERMLAPSSQARIWVAERDGAVVAFASWGPPLEQPAEPGLAELTTLYQQERAAGTGAGAALLHAAVEEMRAQGFSRAMLWVLATNERARRFYERHGWSADGGRRADSLGGLTIEEVRYGAGLR